MRDMQVVPYDPLWVQHFENESNILRTIIGNNLETIYHMGSTSIPGIFAKPVIDILVSVRELNLLNKEDFEKEGYIWRGERGIPFRRFLYKGHEKRTHHLHIFQEHDPQIQRHLLFRDYICAHPDAFERYESLKKQLAEKYRFDQFAYTSGKDDFISEIIDKAGFKGITLFEALLKKEWDGYHSIRSTHHPLYDSSALVKNEQIKHFVFKRGGQKIVAAAELSLKESGWEVTFLECLPQENLKHYRNRLQEWIHQT